MACVVLVGGIPGSGKSTIIDYLLKQKKLLNDVICENQPNSLGNEIKTLNDISSQSKYSEVVSISYDEICAVSEQQRLVDVPNGWKDFRKDFLDAVECYICFLCHLKYEPSDVSSRTKMMYDYMINKYNYNNVLESRVVFLVEDNFYYSNKLGFCQIFLYCPVDVACKRNNTRMISVPENVIQIMSEKVEVPDVKKNPWEKFSFVYNTMEEYGALPVSEIVELIRTAAENPPEPVMDVSEQKREAQMICSQNVIHQADKILRRLTGQVIKKLLTESRSKEDLKVLTSKINQERQKLLKDLSEGTLFLPLGIAEALKNCETESKTVEAEEHLFLLMETKLSEILRT